MTAVLIFIALIALLAFLLGQVVWFGLPDEEPGEKSDDPGGSTGDR